MTNDENRPKLHAESQSTNETPRACAAQADMLDWNLDHPHTNFKDAFDHLRARGYFVEARRSVGMIFRGAYGSVALRRTKEG